MLIIDPKAKFLNKIKIYIFKFLNKVHSQNKVFMSYGALWVN